MQKVKDLTNQKFNHLTAIKHVGKDNNNKSLWLFKCDCGNEKVIRGTNVTSGVVKSCGCMMRGSNIECQREKLREITKNNQGRTLRLRNKPYSNNKTGYNGISIDNNRPNNKYICNICYNKKKYYKSFKKLDEAREWIENKRKELYEN